MVTFETYQRWDENSSSGTYESSINCPSLVRLLAAISHDWPLLAIILHHINYSEPLINHDQPLLTTIVNHDNDCEPSIIYCQRWFGCHPQFRQDLGSQRFPGVPGQARLGTPRGAGMGWCSWQRESGWANKRAGNLVKWPEATLIQKWFESAGFW